MSYTAIFLIVPRRPLSKMSALCVAVDANGCVGVFLGPEEARKTLTPYLDAHWRGIILQWENKGELRSGDDAYIVMPDIEVGRFPLFVGSREEATEIIKTLAPSGLVEEEDELEFRVARIGEIIPSAEKRIGFLLQKTEGPDTQDSQSSSAAVQNFMAVVKKDILQQTQRLIPDEECLPLAAYMCQEPAGFATESITAPETEQADISERAEFESIPDQPSSAKTEEQAGTSQADASSSEDSESSDSDPVLVEVPSS